MGQDDWCRTYKTKMYVSNKHFFNLFEEKLQNRYLYVPFQDQQRMINPVL